MPLPSSGPLSLNDIQTEFGGTNPIGLNEYYAGGGLVPAGTTGTNGAVPSSGAISIFNFYGTSNFIPYWSQAISIGGNPAAYPQASVYSVGSNLIWGERDWAGNDTRFYLYSVDGSTGALNYRRQIQSVNTLGTFFGGYTGYFVDSSGTATVTRTQNNGYFQIYRINSSGTIIWSKQLDNRAPDLFGLGNGVATDSSGNAYLLGYRITSGGLPFARLMKLDNNGNFVWATEIQEATYATSASNPTSVRVDSSGNVIVSIIGSDSSNRQRPLIVKLDTNGNLLGAVVIRYNANNENLSQGAIAISSAGNIYGLFSSPSYRFVCYNFNSSLALQWMQNVPSATGGPGNSLYLDSTNNIYAPYSAPGVYGILSLSSSGAFRWARNISAAPSPGEYSYLNNLGVGLQGSSVFALTNGFNSAVTPNNVGNVVKFPTTGSLSGYYPTLSSTRGIYLGVSTQPSSASNVAADFTITSVTPSLTTLSWSVSNLTNPTVTSLSATVTNTAYSSTSTSGSYVYPYGGVYSWIAPSGVTAISTVAIGGGSGGNSCWGGAGGGLGYRNNQAVTPGTSYYVQVGGGGSGGYTTGGENGGVSYIGTSSSLGSAFAIGYGGSFASSGGSYSGSGGGQGGNSTTGYGGGGGAGGYSGNGGVGGSYGNPGTAGSGGAGGGGGSVGFCYTSGVQQGGGGGGGVSVIGQGPSGSGGTSNSVGGAGSYGTVLTFGGGGYNGGYYLQYYGCPCNEYYVPMGGSAGGGGAVRIVWPGNTRLFPSTNVGSL